MHSIMSGFFQSRGSAGPEKTVERGNGTESIPDRKAFLNALMYHIHGGIIVTYIEHFKEFNDVYGREKGDKLVKAVLGEMKRSIGDYGEIYRISGDAFCALTSCTDTIELGLLSEKISHMVKDNTCAAVTIKTITTPNYRCLSTIQSYLLSKEILERMDYIFCEEEKTGRKTVHHDTLTIQ